MRESVRLVFRMHRFEIVALGVFTAVLVGAAFWVAAEMDAVGYGACYRAAAPPAGCEALGRRFFDIEMNQASAVFSFMNLLPYAAGILLGAPLIARELERGTTRLAWSITPSRIRWYAWRVAPIVVFSLAITFVAGIAVDRLIAARSPGIDLANSFDTFGQRGVLVAVIALVMLAGSIGLGSVIGRVLPTVILALVLGYFGIDAVQHLHADFTAREAIYIDEADVSPADRYIDQFFKLPDGRIVGWEQLAQIDPSFATGDSAPTYPIVTLVVTGDHYREVETREALILGGIAAVMLVGTGVIVAVRRPG